MHLSVVSERLHVGGFLVRLADNVTHTFVVVTEHDPTGLSWGSMEGGTADGWKIYIDGVLRSVRHDCLELGCLPWLDRSHGTHLTSS